MKNNKLLIVLLSALLCVSACGSDEPEKHKIWENGTETGVRVEVILKGGGSAVLVCPIHKTAPLGAHGRECYLESTNDT